jgi:hypothetical protein
VGIKLNSFLNSVLVGDEWSTSRLGLFILTERVPFRYWRRGWVDFGGWLEALDKRQISYACQEPNHNSSPFRAVVWSLYQTRWITNNALGRTRKVRSWSNPRCYPGDFLKELWDIMHNVWGQPFSRQ